MPLKKRSHINSVLRLKKLRKDQLISILHPFKKHLEDFCLVPLSNAATFANSLLRNQLRLEVSLKTSMVNSVTKK